MSKQRPNPERMTNELVGASAFFRPATLPNQNTPPASTTPDAPVSPPQAAASQPSTEPEFPTRPARTPVRPERRQMVRHAFELYLDQIESLRNLAEAQRRRGEPSSMSRMVRDAIDRVLDETPSKESH